MRRKLRNAFFAVSAVAMVLGCIATWLGASMPAEKPALSGTESVRQLKVGDRERKYLAYVPKGLKAGAPVVLALHGSGMDGVAIRQWTGYELDALADQRGFVVVYPDGYRGNWNACLAHAPYPAAKENVDDVGFVMAILAQLVEEHQVASEQLYLFGYSNGGTMAYRLEAERPEVVKALAVFGSNLPVPENDRCRRDGATSRVMLTHGTKDPIVPFAGGEATLFGFSSRGLVMSSDATVAFFVERNGLQAPTTTALGTDGELSVSKRVWMREGQPYVQQFTVENGGHVVPQAKFRFARLMGPTATVLDGPEEAVDFFFGAK